MNTVAKKRAATRKVVAIRATAEERRIIALAARREQRSINSFMLHAALDAAQGAPSRRRTPEEVQAAIDRAQALMRPYRKPGESLVDKVIAERRAEAEREG